MSVTTFVTGTRLSHVQRRASHHIVAADLAMAAGFPAEAFEQVELGLHAIGRTGEDALRIELCGVGIRALAEGVELARARGLRLDESRARLLADRLLEQIDRIAVLGHENGADDPSVLIALAWCTAERGRLDPVLAL